MSHPIIYVDRSEILEGQFEALRAGMAELTAFVEANEPEIPSYTVHFDKDRARMTVIHIHQDASTLERHLSVAGGEFPRVAPFIRLQAIDVYGDPGEELAARLRAKAEMLGTGLVRIHDFHAGFSRLSA